MVPVDLFMHILHAKPRASRKLEENVRSEATSTDRDSTVHEIEDVEIIPFSNLRQWIISEDITLN